jgi:hypothetical protein
MPDTVAKLCNPSTQAETGRLRIYGQPELHSEILSQKTKQTAVRHLLFNF